MNTETTVTDDFEPENDLGTVFHQSRLPSMTVGAENVEDEFTIEKHIYPKDGAMKTRQHGVYLSPAE